MLPLKYWPIVLGKGILASMVDRKSALIHTMMDLVPLLTLYSLLQRFPWFRIAYFLLWTGIFVNVHWILHANVSIW
jgi:hypothetical protein